MMPLYLAEPGGELVIRKVGGSPEIKKHLEDMGFTAGERVSLISQLGGNIIIRVKESRVALSRELAGRIMV